MPWTGKSFADKHNHELGGAKATKAAKVANAILARTGDEGLAIATANKRASSPRMPGFAGKKRRSRVGA